MRVCFIGDAGHVNLLTWVRFYARQPGHEVHVVTFNPPCEDVERVAFHRLQPPFGSRRLRYIVGIPSVRRIVREIAPDLVIGYRINSYGLLAASTGVRPLVLVAQGNDLWEPALPTVVSRFTARRADLLHSWAPHMTRKLIELGGDPRRILTLPKGVNTEVFRPSEVPVDEPVLISTRQLRAEYRHDLILHAVARVLKKSHSVRYIVCGDGPDRSKLGRIARELNIAAAVEFRGSVPNQDLACSLRQAQVYVAMISEDGVSASLIEAMACGVFPIVPDIEPNRAWVTDGINGFLVPPDDVGRLASRITAALDDPRLREESQRMNWERVSSRACMSTNLAKMERCHRQLLSGHAVANA